MTESIILAAMVSAVVEAAKQEASTGQVITWTAVAMAIVSNIGTWLMILKRQSKKGATAQPGNPGPSALALNGVWKEVREHGETLVAHDTEIKNIVKGFDENRKENREEHQTILSRINALKGRLE